jgi:transcriptional regulator with XRE-family HTH domain
MNTVESKKVGDLLRDWRERRRLSQLNLAYDAEISQKHLSFLELGRSQPSHEMILRLAEQLNIPLRERNILLTAAGFAPVFPETPLTDESLAAARHAIDLILNRLEPYPSFAVDRRWELLAANKAVDILLAEVDASLLVPPVNMLRLCLHPKGFAPQVINYAEWRKDVLEFLNRQVEITADAFLTELLEELKGYSLPHASQSSPKSEYPRNMPISAPLRLRTKEGDLTFMSVVTVFGTPIDVTLSELAIESYFPADEKTAEVLNRVFK